MDNQQLVSILIPYYNDEIFISDAIKSVLEQTYKNFELILLNHASEDNSRNIAHSFDDFRIKHIDMKKNLGAGGALLIIEFLKHVKGDFIKLFAADDILKPNYLEKMIQFSFEHPEADLFFSDTEFIDVNNKIIKGKHSTTRREFKFDNSSIYWIKLYLKGISSLPYTTNLIRTKSFKEFAVFNKTAIMLQDVTLWLSMLINDKKIAISDESLAYYRIHDGQISSLKNLNIAYKRSYYEHNIVTELFYKIKNFKTFREVFNDSKYINLVTCNDDEFYKEFVVAHYFLDRKEDFTKINAYIHMHNLLQDDLIRVKLEEKFSFGIKEFRELYSRLDTLQNNKISWFKKQKEKQGKNISLLGLLYLEIRAIFHIILLKKIKEKLKNKNKQLSA